MRFNIQEMEADQEKQDGGVWVEFGSDARFKIASTGSTSYTDALKAAIKPYSDLGRDVPKEENETMIISLMANHILKDFKGVYDGDKELKYSHSNAVKILSIPMLRDKIYEQAQNFKNFKANKDKETEKN